MFWLSILVVSLVVIAVVLYMMNKNNVDFKTIYLLIKGVYSFYIYPLFTRNKEKIIYKNKKWNEDMLKGLHIKLITKGTMVTNKPVLYVANHHHFIDGLIIKSLHPKTYLIGTASGKNELPMLKNIMGSILENYGVIPYERGDKNSGKKVREMIAKTILEKKRSVIVFPEGTTITSFGPQKFFKGSFEVAFNNNIIIQPITIKYDGNCGWGRKTSVSKDHNLDLMKNLEYMRQRNHKCYVVFHKPIHPKDFENGIKMKDYCHRLIKKTWKFMDLEFGKNQYMTIRDKKNTKEIEHVEDHEDKKNDSDAINEDDIRKQLQESLQVQE